MFSTCCVFEDHSTIFIEFEILCVGVFLVFLSVVAKEKLEAGEAGEAGSL
jgi:hypothetical protein